MENTIFLRGAEVIGEALGVSTKQVYTFIDCYGLPAKRLGGYGPYVIARSKLQNWADTVDLSGPENTVPKKRVNS